MSCGSRCRETSFLNLAKRICSSCSVRTSKTWIDCWQMSLVEAHCWDKTLDEILIERNWPGVPTIPTDRQGSQAEFPWARDFAESWAIARSTCSKYPIEGSEYPPFRDHHAINSSEIISRNDYSNFAQSSQKQFFRIILAQWQNGYCTNQFLEACHKNSKKSESNNKNAQSPWKQFPKSYFTQSIVTISRNPLKDNSSILFCGARNVFWMEGKCSQGSCNHSNLYTHHELPGDIDESAAAERGCGGGLRLPACT